MRRDDVVVFPRVWEASAVPQRSTPMTTRPRPRILALAEAGGASAAAFALAALIDQDLYERFIVPVLPHSDSVPLYLWTIARAPGAILILAAAIVPRSLFGLVVASLPGAVARHAVLTQFARHERPGHFKSFAVEDPQHWWTTHLLVSIVETAVCLVLARSFLSLARFALRRKTPPLVGP